MKRIPLLAVPLIALAACTATPAPEAPAPAPTVTVTAPAPEPEPVAEQPDSLGLVALTAAWQEQSPSEQESICWMYELSPKMVWKGLKEAADGVATRAEVEAFLDAECAQ